MTKLFSLFILLSFVLPVSGQKKLDSDKARKEKAYHLTGSVREQGERPYPDPLPDVNIQLYSLPDTSFIEGTVSDKKGVFRLYPMNPGNYLIRASFIARMNSTCSGGSSSVLSSALNAPMDSICTSSMMNTRFLTCAGV